MDFIITSLPLISKPQNLEQLAEDIEIVFLENG